MIDPDRTEHYWLGSLAMTVALASIDPRPQPILKTALQEFLRDRPAGDELATMLRATVKGNP